MIAVMIWLLAIAALALGWMRFGAGYPPPRHRLARLAPRDAAFVESAAEAMFPSGGAIPLSGIDADLPGFVDRYLDVLHPGKRTLIRLLLLLFEQATLVFPAPGTGGFRRFSRLTPAQREAVLEAWSSSDIFLRRIVFSALRAVLTMGYLGHPVVLRHLHLAPFEFETPVVEADLLYPRIGASPASIVFSAADLTQPSDGSPLPIDGPIHPSYRGDA